MARILVVEDAADQRMLICARLRQAGHKVLDADCAQGALDLVASHGMPEVAVLDVGLPDCDGPELLGRLRAAAPDGAFLGCVFLSAAVTTDDIARGIAAGGLYLTKPFVATALLAAIERSLAQRNEAIGSESSGW